MEAIDGQTQRLVESMTEEGKEINIQELLDQLNEQNQLKILIIDEDGKVVYKTKERRKNKSIFMRRCVM